MALAKGLFDFFYERSHDAFALVIYIIQMVDVCGRVFFGLGDEHIESVHRRPHARRGIDARRDHKSDIIFAQIALIDLELRKEFHEAFAPTFAQDRHSIMSEDAILADERHHIRHRGDADEIEKPFFMAFFERERRAVLAGLFKERLDELIADAGAAEIFVGI